LLQAWQQRGWLACLLWPLSLVYRLIVAWRCTFYRWAWLPVTRLPVPVVVVGNVVAGGVGKTPVVIALVTHLQQRGILVGVVSRGFGRSQTGCIEVTRNSLAQDVGDEPALIQRRTGVPVFVAERRVEAALALVARYPQTQLIVSDDGLQHLQLARNLEIGVFDDRGVGNGFLLPAGPLREPWPRPLDLVLHTGSQPAFEGFQAHRALADHALRADGSRLPLAELQTPDHPPLMALAAIAQPGAFFAMLRAQGLTLTRTLALPDHFNFDSYSRTEYVGYSLICTEKDAVKLWPLQPEALAVPLLCELPDAFWRAFDAQLDHLLS
jgi:tetraacyldisaccharide 4'-kinase